MYFGSMDHLRSTKPNTRSVLNEMYRQMYCQNIACYMDCLRSIKPIRQCFKRDV